MKTATKPRPRSLPSSNRARNTWPDLPPQSDEYDHLLVKAATIYCRLDAAINELQGLDAHRRVKPLGRVRDKRYGQLCSVLEHYDEYMEDELSQEAFVAKVLPGLFPVAQSGTGIRG